MRSRRLILRSTTINTWSEREVGDKMSLNFIVNWGIFDLSGGLNSSIIIKVQLFGFFFQKNVCFHDKKI